MKKPGTFRTLVWLAVFLLALPELRARPQEDPESKSITFTVSLVMAKDAYTVNVQGETVFPRGTALKVALYLSRRDMTGAENPVEVDYQTVRVENKRFFSSTNLSTSSDSFLPARYVVTVFFNYDTQMQSTKDAISSGNLSTVAISKSRTFWIGDAGLAKQILSADRQRMEEVLAMLDAVSAKIAQVKSGTYGSSAKVDLDKISFLLDAGRTLAPLSRDKAKELLRYLYWQAGGRGNDQAGGIKVEVKPSDQSVDGNDASPSGAKKEGPCACKEVMPNCHCSHCSLSASDQKHASCPCGGLRAATADDVKNTFVREYTFGFITILERLNEDCESSLENIEGWKKFYDNDTASCKVLQALLTDIYTSSTFSEAYEARFGKRDVGTAATALNTHRALADYGDDLVKTKNVKKGIPNAKLVELKASYRVASDSVMKAITAK